MWIIWIHDAPGGGNRTGSRVPALYWAEIRTNGSIMPRISRAGRPALSSKQISSSRFSGRETTFMWCADKRTIHSQDVVVFLSDLLSIKCRQSWLSVRGTRGKYRLLSGVKSRTIYPIKLKIERSCPTLADAGAIA